MNKLHIQYSIVVIVAAVILSFSFFTTSFAQETNDTCESTTQKEFETRAGDLFTAFDNATQSTIVSFVCSVELDLGTFNDDEIKAVLLEAGVVAQNAIPFDAVSENSGSATLTSCFNYYSFGSVIPHLSTEFEEVVSGTTLYVQGTIENTNPYPIVDGTLYVKVFKKRGDGTQKDPNGPDVVDQFVAMHDISIDTNSSIPVSFEWEVPAYTIGGDYEIATFFTTSKRYNLLGLAFTDDIVGTTVRFKVSGDQKEGISFVKDSVTLNERDYFFAAYPPRFSSDEQVDVSAIIKNTTGGTITVPVTFELYRWDQQRHENLLETKKTSVTLKAGESVPVKHLITNTEHPVYLLVVTSNYGDTKTVLNIRFVRQGLEGARINFPSLVGFPLKKGEPNGIFSCMHSMSDKITSDSEVRLSLTDKRGNEIYKTNYVGSITGSMMGMVGAFKPNKDYDYTELTAELFKEGILVESIQLTYDCTDINPNLCNESATIEMFGLDTVKLTGVGVGTLVILSLLVWYALPKKREEESY